MIFLDPIFWMAMLAILPIYYKVKAINTKNVILLLFSIIWYVR